MLYEQTEIAWKSIGPTWRPQNVGLSTYFSACRPFSLGNAISTAKLMFSRFANSMEPNAMLYNHTESGKSIMAAAKTEILISQLADQLKTLWPPIRHVGLTVPE